MRYFRRFIEYETDRYVLYTELNMHLGLINDSDDVDTIFDKSVALYAGQR